MGNPLFKNYNVEKEHFLTGGFNNLWKIYRGTRKDRKQDVCVFVLDKKSLDKYSKEEKEEILNVLKKEASSLVKFKHPGVLGIYEQLAEDKTSLAFITEPIDYTLTSWLETQGASKLEIKLIVTELCNVISFLHDDAHVIHSALNPDEIFITQQGHIKLSGLEFSLSDPNIGGMEVKLNSAFPNALPSLKYVAPEIIIENKGFYQSDIFSIGMIIYNMLKFHKGDTDRELLNMNGSNTIDSYKKALDVMDNKLMRVAFENDDNDVIFRSLNKKPTSRPTIKEYLEHSWFNDPKLKALRFVENLEQNEATKNEEFLKKFPNILHLFENKIIERRFLPAFMNALKNESLIVNTLPAIFAICEDKNNKIDFEQVVWPGLKTLFGMKQIPAAGLYFLLSKLNYIAEKISNSEFSSNMLNIICKALDCGVAKIQSVVLDNLLFIIKKVDSLAFKNQIYPRLVNIVLNTTSPTLKVAILKSFSTVYSLLDQNIINESLLNTLEKIRKADNNSDVCMCVVSIYEEIAKVVSVESIANKILPNLISILVSGNISKKGFESIMTLVQKYLARIKESREKDLQDENAENKESLNTFSSLGNTSQPSSKVSTKNEKDDFSFMDSFFGAPSKNSITPKTSTLANDTDFDYINQSLQEAKKSSLKLEPKKEKTIFDGIKESTSNTGINLMNQTKEPIGSFKIENKRDSTLDKFNFGSFGNDVSKPTIGSSQGSNNNFSTNKTSFDNAQKAFPNIDFSKNTTKPKDLNILDSLLSDLPGGNATTKNGFDMNFNQANINVQNNLNFNQNTNNFNFGGNTTDDYYNLDFLKTKNNQMTNSFNQNQNKMNYNMGGNSNNFNTGNTNNQTNANNDPFFNLLKK